MDHLKIGSPSKVLFEIGQFTGEGFVNGLMAMLAAVRRTSELMASAAIQPIVPKVTDSFVPGVPGVGAVAGVAAAGSVVNAGGVTVNVPNAGLDEDQVAAYTVSKLNRILTTNTR